MTRREPTLPPDREFAYLPASRILPEVCVIEDDEGPRSLPSRIGRDLAKGRVRIYLVASALLWGVASSWAMRRAFFNVEITEPVTWIAVGTAVSAALAGLTLVLRPTSAAGCVGLGMLGPYVGAALQTWCWAWLFPATFGGEFHDPPPPGDVPILGLVGPLTMPHYLLAATPPVIATLFWFRWAVGGGGSRADALPTGTG